MSKRGLLARLYAPNQTLTMVKAELPRRILGASKCRQVRPLESSSRNGTETLPKQSRPSAVGKRAALCRQTGGGITPEAGPRERASDQDWGWPSVGEAGCGRC